ncbi:MAG: putative 4-hydroxybenzoate polyprenyltransferase [Planctomycetota bacterium]|nr:putative 4-hydroxybenzoate polyprenyltransferase [Planctomycetota bacterium]
MARIQQVLSMVKFSHSIFALPFALQAAWLAAGGMPEPVTLTLILVAAVAARTAAMAFNRWADRDIDGDNPRTASREIPSGVLSANYVLAVVIVSSVVFVAASWALNPLAGKLSFPVLAVLLGYSLVKRFSFLAHMVLGLALALAPLAAWIAVRGTADGLWGGVAWLAVAVWTWVGGFDVIYSCQDADYDREHGLHSIPARFGVSRALVISRCLHVVTVVCLVQFGMGAQLGWIYMVAIGISACLLAWEQSLVKAHDLSRVNLAFFTINGWIGVMLFLALMIDLAWISGGQVL